MIEVWPKELETVKTLVKTEMGKAADLLVPLDVSIGVGSSWDQAAH